MIKERQKIFLNILGGFFLIWGVIAILNSMYANHPMQIFYFCYLGLLLIGIGILTKNSFLILSQVYILAIPLLVWDIDFIHWIIFQKSLWGITDYFFIGEHSLIGKIISLQHLFTVPLAIYSAKLIGLKRKDAWKMSFIQATLVFIAVNIFTNPESNINCIFSACLNVYFGLPYRLTWFIIFFSLISITALILNLTLFGNKKES